MVDKRHRNIDWNIGEEDGSVRTWERAGVAVLMDIRDELQALNRLLSCPNFTAIPYTLRTIARQTLKVKPKRKQGKA